MRLAKQSCLEIWKILDTQESNSLTPTKKRGRCFALCVGLSRASRRRFKVMFHVFNFKTV